MRPRAKTVLLQLTIFGHISIPSILLVPVPTMREHLRCFFVAEIMLTFFKRTFYLVEINRINGDWIRIFCVS